MPRRTPSNTNTTTDDYSASTATTGVVVVGSSFTGNIESRSDHDWFAVTLEAGVTYQLRAGSASGSNRLSDTVLYLRDALITYAATETGTYYLDVSGYGSQTGNYVVSATAVDSSTNTDDYTADTTTTGIVEVGSPSTGTIESGSDHDWFAVTLEAGVTYQLQAGSASGTDSLADTFLYLRDESGALLTLNDDANAYTLDSLITYTATETGTYYLDVAAYGRNETGDYVVSATVVDTDTDSTSDFNIDIIYSGNSKAILSRLPASSKASSPQTLRIMQAWMTLSLQPALPVLMVRAMFWQKQVPPQYAQKLQVDFPTKAS